MDVVDDGLSGGAATRGSDKQSHLLCLHLEELEDDSQRGQGGEHDDAKGANCPAPRRVVDERLGCKWSGESCADEWGADKGKGESTVTQSRRVSKDDIHAEVHCTVADLL